MNYRKILAATAALIFTGTMAFAQIRFSEEDKAKISEGLNSFATELMYVIPETSTQQNVWADAFIGKLFPALPPHLGGGITIGATMLNAEGVKDAATAMIGKVNDIAGIFNTNASGLDARLGSLDFKEKLLNFGELPSKIILPTATVDLRIGGLILPFDIGICAMMTNPNLTAIDLSNPMSVLNANGNLKFGGKKYNGTVDFLTLGGDIRFALLEGDLILPQISLGGGYYYTAGSIGFSAKPDPLKTDFGNLGRGTQITTADINLAYNTQTAFLQLEVSKKIAIVTVFGGARGIISNSTNSWSWSFKTENIVDEDSPQKETYANNIANLFYCEENDSGTVSSGNDITEDFKNGKWDFKGIQPQVYAGVGFNFLVLQTTLGVCADISSLYRKNTDEFVWSGFFSFRAKL